jgi:hypothetical protein
LNGYAAIHASGSGGQIELFLLITS